jgi:hypothetical protein
VKAVEDVLAHPKLGFMECARRVGENFATIIG